MIRQIISHYRILEKLGEGAFGAVYCAEDLKLKRKVAIKFSIAPPDDPNYRDRFLREAQLASNLDHPNIARIYSYGETPDDLQYIVMELVKGQTLQEVLLRGSLGPEKSVEVVSAIAEALAEAHKHHVIHRDIKPGNVMLTEGGGVKVLDFGLAKRLKVEAESCDSPQPFSQTLTGKGIVMGTPGYMSPEQVRGENLKHSSDLFSLGAVLYECLTGEPPFSGKNRREVCQHVVYTDPFPPSRINPQISSELERVALKALAKSPDARYQSATELLTDLKPSHTVREITALPSTEIIAPTIAPPVFDPVQTTQYLPSIESGSLMNLKFSRNWRLLLAGLVSTCILLAIGLWLWKTFRSPKLLIPVSSNARELYEQGLQALRVGTYYRARRVLQEVTKVEPGFAPAHARLAEALLELELNNEALEEIAKSHEKMPSEAALDSVDALYLRAINLTATRQFAAAREVYQQVARRMPDADQWVAESDLGRAYEKADDQPQAVASYERALSLKRQQRHELTRILTRLGVLYGRVPDLGKSGASFDEAMKLCRDGGNYEGLVEVFYQRGVLFNQMDEFAQAIAQLREGLPITRIAGSENKYQEIKFLLQLSSAYSEIESQQARDYARQAIALAEGRASAPDSHAGTGTQITLSDPFEKSVFASLATQGHLELGNAYFADSQDPEGARKAEAEYTEALRLAQLYKQPRNEARAHFSLASVYINEERGLERGLAELQQAINLYQSGGYNFELARAEALLAQVRTFRGDSDGALAAYQRQLSLAERTGQRGMEARAYYGIGTVLAVREEYPAALANFQRSYDLHTALKIPIRQFHSQLQIADLYWQLGEEQKGQEQLAIAAAAIEPQESKLAELRGWLALIRTRWLLNQGKFAAAAAQAEQARSLVASAADVQSERIEAEYLLGLARALARLGRDGVRWCGNAVDNAKDDKQLLASATLAYAEALLADGSADQAVKTALAAQRSFAGFRWRESEWRAWLIAARANRLAGNLAEAKLQALEADSILTKAEQEWAAAGFPNYSRRPDIVVVHERLSTLLGNAVGKEIKK